MIAALNRIVSITCNVEEAVDKILLNIKDLEVNSIKVNNENIQKYQILEKAERLEIEPQKSLNEGEEIKIYIEYKGCLSSSLGGFYRVKQRENVFGGACHFEPTGARKAFPCWDEPSFRATFSITIRSLNLYIHNP